MVEVVNTNMATIRSVKIDHDDAEREFRYLSAAQTFTKTEPITDVGARLGWTGVSMANHWDPVFPPGG